MAALLKIINAHMHEGTCPGAGALGECAAICGEVSSAGHFYGSANLYLWTAAADLRAATVAQWFLDAGCTEVVIEHTLHDDMNDIVEGRCTFDGVRPWLVTFDAPDELLMAWGLVAPGRLPRPQPAVKMISADEIEIHGVRYAVDAFEHLGLGPIGATLRIIKREDGVVTLEKLPAEEPQTQAATDVLAERQRQINVEGYNSSEDDANNDLGQLAQAAACYAALGPWRAVLCPANWPWLAEQWKPKDYRSNLIRAGALILAEIERLDRAAIKQAEAG